MSEATVVIRFTGDVPDELDKIIDAACADRGHTVESIDTYPGSLVAAGYDEDTYILDQDGHEYTVAEHNRIVAELEAER